MALGRLPDTYRSRHQLWQRGPTGYERRRAETHVFRAAPVITAVRPRHPNGLAVPFIGLAEAYALAAFRSAGVPMQRIRPAIDALARELGLAHALASRQLYTDGAEVLYDYAQHAGGTPEGESARELVVVRNNQRVFTEVVELYLKLSTSRRTATPS